MLNTQLNERRAKIKFWLDISGMTRQELADKVKVHISSLNGWLSNKSIPDKRWIEIKAIFEPEEKSTIEPDLMRAVAVGFTSEELRDLKEIDGDTPLDILLRELALEKMRDILNRE